MKNIGIVHGSKESAKPLIVNIDTVYAHTDIKHDIIKDEETGQEYEDWSYNEVQYTKDEYIKKIAMENKALKENDLNNQLAIALLFETKEV